MEDGDELSLGEADNGKTNSMEGGAVRNSRRKRRQANISKSGEHGKNHITRSGNGSNSIPHSTKKSNAKQRIAPMSVMSGTTEHTDSNSNSESELQDQLQPASPESTANMSYEKGVKKFKCAQCGAMFTTNSYLTVHKRSHSGEKPYRCQYPDCSMAFTAATSLRRHENIHTKARRFVCQDCGDVFTQSSSLNTHRRKHTGYRPFQCEVCPRTFASSSHLKKHLLMHSGEKPHVCPDCGAQFSNSHNLKRHLMIHSGQRPFMCRECGDAFITNDDLKRHVQTHSIRKQFMCQYCPANFSRAGRLRKHELRHVRYASDGRLARECAAVFFGEDGGQRQLLCGGGATDADLLQRYQLKCERGVFPELSEACSNGPTGASDRTTLGGLSKSACDEDESSDSDAESPVNSSHFDSSTAAEGVPTEILNQSLESECGAYKEMPT